MAPEIPPGPQIHIVSRISQISYGLFSAQLIRLDNQSMEAGARQTNDDLDVLKWQGREGNSQRTKKPSFGEQ